MEFVKKAGFKGYKSFEFLEEGVDYPAIEWPEWDWVGRHVIPLSDEQEAMVQEIVKNNVMISVHDHPCFHPKDMSNPAKFMDAYRCGRQFIAYEALAYSYLDCVFDNLADGTNLISSMAGWKWNDIIHDLGTHLCDIAHQDFLIQCKTVDDIYRAKREGKIAWVPVIEGAGPIENEIDRIDILYGLGVRQLGVTYSESNALGNGLKEDNDAGLTVFGRQCVERMNKVGMLIDVSHCGPKTAYDTAVFSKKPVLASHLGTRSVWNIKRMFPDEVIVEIAKRGGVIGVEASPHTTMSYTTMTHSMDTVMEHFEHIKNLVGIDHVTFGPDTLYGNHVGLHHAFDALFSTKYDSDPGVPYEEVPFVKYLENPTEASWNLVRELVRRGYKEEEIAKVLGGNTLRVLKEVWA